LGISMLHGPQMKSTEELDNSSSRHGAKALVIADDLTGACDAGVQFARCGLSSIVELSSSGAHLDAEVRIANSRSRHQSPQAAAEEVERLTRRMAPGPHTICFKKVDSTLRGNIAFESTIMMRAAGLDFAVLAPALPAQGRTVARGVLHVRDCTKSWTTDVRTLLSRQGLEKIALLSASVAASPEKLVQEMLQLHASGAEFILCDSETEQDLERIARAMHQLPQRTLWIGSSGLAKYAAQILAAGPDSSRSARTTSPAKIATSSAPNSDRRSAPILFCIGSDHPVTLLQVKCLEESGTARALDAKTATRDEVREVVQQGRHPLLLLYAAHPDRERIRMLIAEAGSAGISAVFLSGGNTAELVCDTIGAAAIRLQDELLPGIPLGIFHGGLLDGLPVATKAGGFGDENALVNAANLLSVIEPDAA
jgi:D-threonate/D-erythronate kinase